MKKIYLNNETSIDLPVLMETKLAVLANSGGGKSWAIRRIIEQSFGKVQIIIIDPESEYGNLRKEFDFVLAGEGGEVITKTHIAAKLAERLMKLKASAIIDLYELLPQDRKRFVRLFLDSLMNLPKDMQTPVLLVIDEAHVFAPEGKPSEASTSMEALASQGRKRNIGLILATQRISKMSKDVLAECNNKMIGRMSLDIDRKRAGDELGFTGKEQVLSLRNLKPGEFYVFGSAISDDILTVKVGDVRILPPKRGVIIKGATPPTEGVKKLIAQLADLPQEAQKEAQTVAELKKENTQLKIDLKKEQNRKVNMGKTIVDLDWTEREVQKAVAIEGQRKEKEFFVERNNLIRDIKNRESVIQKIVKLIEPFTINIVDSPFPLPKKFRMVNIPDTAFKNIDLDNSRPQTRIGINKEGVLMSESEHLNPDLNVGEKIILNAIAQQTEGITTEHIAVLTGYKQTSRVVYLQKLTQRGLIDRRADHYFVTEAGMETLGSDFKPLPEGAELREHLLNTLPEGEKRVFQAIIGGAENKEQIMFSTGYKSTSVTVYVQKLAARKAITSDRGEIKLNQKLI